MRRKRKGPLGCLFSLLKIAFLIALLAAIYLGYGIYQNVKRVETYREQVATLTKKYQIEGYENLVLAIIYTESKGKGTDLMQSSESLSGEQESIVSQNESLDQGVQYLSRAIQRIDYQKDQIDTAVQAYNFGLDYIDYVEANGGSSTLDLTERYSKEILAPILGNNEEKTYRYWQLPAILHNGGYLYQNGGNIFYAKIVRTNQFWIASYNKFFS